jgi:type IV secretory pathway TraG/TraD family ATPase VirD4
VTTWGRDPNAGRWMPAVPVAKIGALLGAVLIAGTVAAIDTRHWTDDQRHFLGRYVHRSIAASLSSLWVPNKKAQGKRDRYIEHRDRLSAELYGGQSIIDMVRRPALAGGVGLALLLPFAIAADLKRQRERHAGRRVEGPELVSAARMTASGDGKGFVIKQAGMRPSIILSRELETYHTLVVGGTGTGKSLAISERIEQIVARGERAIVLDPSGEFLQRFYRDGDVVLHPWDARSPAWLIGDEIRTDLDADAIAEAIIPRREHETTHFFSDSARNILAALLMRRPSTEQLVEWMTDQQAIAAALKGTPQEPVIANIMTPGSEVTRANIMSELNLYTKILQWCPPRKACDSRWSATEWAKTGTGLIFITGTPSTRTALGPLQTLWINTLIMRLLDRLDGPKTHVLLDEIDTLPVLSQLSVGLTEARKYNVAFLIGCQSYTQLEGRYGQHAAATMLEQAATQIFLRSSGRIGSKWAAETIGDIEVDRMKQSRQDGWAKTASRSESIEEHVKPMVMASTISGLPRRSGLLKVENLVTTLSIPIVKRPDLVPGFVPRSMATPRPAAPVFEFTMPDPTTQILTHRLE